jgi:hypothetical protein
MKLYRLLLIALMGVAATACENELKEDVQFAVTPTTSSDVTFDGSTITVKKGTAITFNLDGDPDCITFFSGEIGHKYEYKDRTAVDAKDVVSSTMTFSLWAQYGNAASTAGILSMYVSDQFTGLLKNSFATDSANVEKFAWNEFIPQAELPQVPVSNATKAQSYTVDMKSYLGKKLTLAIRYKGLDNSAAQPRMNFVNMMIYNVMADGTTSTLYAGNFGLTPLNMDNKKNYTDQKSMTTNREYGTVTNNTSGIWNLVNASTGSFFIQSSAAKANLKYSWLISDPLEINACTPDEGEAIKDMTQSLATYSYTYSTVGTYTATFIATNANYKKQTSMMKQITIKVVE